MKDDVKRPVIISVTFLIALGLILGIAKCKRRDTGREAKDTSLSMPLSKLARKTGRATEAAREGAYDIQNAFIKVAEKAGKSIVAISTERTQKVGFSGPRMRLKRFGFGSPFDDGEDPFDKFFEDFFGRAPEREFKQKGLGSGFIIDEQGFVLTNHHVVEGADKINVTLPDGRSFPGAIKGSDPRSDLAIIKINAKNLSALELGDSNSIRVGEWAVALGNPFGHILQSPEPTVTVGVISALHRRIPTPGGERGYLDMIQTDAAINPGNSGGPLCDLDGRVIGINVAIFSTSGGYQGVGFAIPANAARDILEDLKKGKEISYGWLGVSIQEITPEIAEYFNLPDRKGVLISEAIPDSPADKAGLKAGDIIRGLNGKPVNKLQDLLREVSTAKIGRPIAVDVIRDRVKKSVDVIIGKRPSRDELNKEAMFVAPEKLEKWRGIKITGITENIAGELNLKDKNGVVIVEVERGSAGHNAGLMAGDVIREINKTKIKNPQDYKKITREARRGLALIRTDRGYFTVKNEKE